MPTYDYECDACGHTMEEFQPITQKPLRKCPECKKPKLRRLIAKVDGEMMNATVYLRKPQTDATTVAIETEIIELLSNAIQTSAGQAGAQGQQMMMAMGMMPQPGMGAGPAGGGSSAGGTTADPNNGLNGDAGGDEAGTRDVRKGGGLFPSGVPEEFKDALESYYEAVEDKP